MPRWLSTVWSVLILGAFGFAIYYSFVYTPFDNSSWVNFRAFIAPGLMLLAYIVQHAVHTFFASADLAATMLVSLLFVAIALAITSSFLPEKSGSRLFEIGLAILGLALGIPFGERLRASERRTRQRQHSDAVPVASNENERANKVMRNHQRGTKVK